MIYLIFISAFALDSFSDNQQFSIQLTSFLIHLIPSMIIMVPLLVSLKNEKVGGTAFIFLGIISVVFFHSYEDLIVFLLISLPLLLIGGLMLMDLANKKQEGIFRFFHK